MCIRDRYVGSSPTNFRDTLGLTADDSYEVHTRNPSAKPSDSAYQSFFSYLLEMWVHESNHFGDGSYNPELRAYLNQSPYICDPTSDWYVELHGMQKMNAYYVLRLGAIYYAQTRLLSDLFGYVRNKTGSQTEGPFEQDLVDDSPLDLTWWRPPRKDDPESRDKAGGQCAVVQPCSRRR